MSDHIAVAAPEAPVSPQDAYEQDVASILELAEQIPGGLDSPEMLERMEAAEAALQQRLGGIGTATEARTIPVNGESETTHFRVIKLPKQEAPDPKAWTANRRGAKHVSGRAGPTGGRPYRNYQ
jgi:hypothetical protein